MLGINKDDPEAENCNKWFELIDLFFNSSRDRKITDAEEKELRVHMAICRSCKIKYDLIGHSKMEKFFSKPEKPLPPKKNFLPRKQVEPTVPGFKVEHKRPKRA